MGRTACSRLSGIVMFSWFEKALAPTVLPENPEPPATLAAFYWHFARQAKGLFGALFVTGFVVALLDVTIPAFIGKVVTLVTTSKPDLLFAQSWHVLVGMALVLLVARPLALTAQNIVANQAIAANVTNLIRPGRRQCARRNRSAHAATSASG